MESKKINQLATELTPSLSDLTIIGDPTTGISKKITLSQMASLFTGTVEEYASVSAFPLVGVADTIYIALDTNVLYRWDTGLTSYVELSPNIINSLVFSDANGFDGTISLVGSVATLTITTALTTGSVAFIGASGALTQDNANFFWDDTNNRLGIGTNAPTTAIDTFGSGIITRVNGTSTNNAFIGFASAGTNKWSIGNVESDHRFRIYNEATTSELVSVLQTGEFGIGIANPTTKLHIDGGATALIANLDANVSVAKSISFRSDNSARINLEVSGTESGTNAGANFYIRTYTDAGALLATPLTITRSTGAATFSNNIAISGQTLSSWGATFGVMQSYYGSYFGATTGGGTVMGNNNYFDGTNYKYVNTDYAGQIQIGSGNILLRVAASGTAGNNVTFTNALTIASTGAATFSNSVNIASTTTIGGIDGSFLRTYSATNDTLRWAFINSSTGIFSIQQQGDGYANQGDRLVINRVGLVGVGTAIPQARLDSYYLSGATSSLGDNIVLAVGTDGGGIGSYTQIGLGYHSRNAGNYFPVIIASVVENSSGQNSEAIAFATRSVTTGTTRPTERVRITGNGYLNVTDNGTYLGSGVGLYNTISTSLANYGSLYIQNSNTSVAVEIVNIYANRNTTNNTFYAFRYYNVAAGAPKLLIADSGNVTNTNNSYGAISDIKLKENIIDTTPKLNDLLKVKIRNYNYIGSEEKQLGVIAQELEQIFPSLIEKHKDKDSEGNDLGTYTKTVKYSVFVPMLIKAIQEQQIQIEELKYK